MPFLVSNHPPSQTHVFDVFDIEYSRCEPGRIPGAGDAEVNEIEAKPLLS